MDINITLGLDTPASEFRPGDMIRGHVLFELPSNSAEQIKLAEIALRWHTEGYGETDSGLGAFQSFLLEKQQAASPLRAQFELKVPALPRTYNGTCIQIHWTLRAVARATRGRECFLVMPVVILTRKVPPPSFAPAS